LEHLGEGQLVDKADYEDVADEIRGLREQKQKVQVENANRDELRKWMADMRAFLRSNRQRSLNTMRNRSGD
jgi:hypothetical protein